MSYCSNCGKKLFENDKFCNYCGTKIETNSITKSEQGKEKSKVIEKIIIKKSIPLKKSRILNTLIKLMVIIILIGGIIFIGIAFIENGGLDNFKGTGIRYIDPCEKAFNECNHACGEGFLNSICKEKCSYDYRKCKR